MSRPERKFTEQDRATIMAMAGYGIKHEDISLVLECDAKTLRKHCKLELDTGSIRATAKVAESLYNQAIKGNTTAGIFWMKVRGGWSERIVIDGNIEHEHTHTHESVSETAKWIAGMLGEPEEKPTKEPVSH